MIVKINWIYEGEHGYWRSSEGRFSISPVGYRNTVSNDAYSLRDELAAHATRPAPARMEYSAYTVGEAKAKALMIAIADLKKEKII